MNKDRINSALADIAGETDQTLKHLKLASLCSVLFAERGIELVVVGGAAIKFYTEGAYTSGDVGLCVLSSREPLTVRLRQEVMGQLAAAGGPRSWMVAGAFVDVLGDFENLARTPVRTISGPFGQVNISPVEELIVERVLVAIYPQDYPPAGLRPENSRCRPGKRGRGRLERSRTARKNGSLCQLAGCKRFNQ